MTRGWEAPARIIVSTRLNMVFLPCLWKIGMFDYREAGHALMQVV